MTITAKFAGRCTKCGGRINVGDTIEWSRAEGGAHETCPEQPADATPVVEELPVPQERTRLGRMMIGGQLDATITLDNGKHVTVFARALRRGTDGWERVGLLDAGARVRVAAAKRGQRIGWIGTGFAIEWDADVTDEVKDATRHLFGALTGSGSREVEPVVGEGNVILNENEIGLFPTRPDAGWTKITATSVCGRCGRELRDPVSIVRGIGPECFGKLTGSKGHEKVKTLKSVPAPVGGTDAEVVRVRNEIAGLQAAIALVTNEAALAALQTEVSKLQGHLAELEEAAQS